MSRFDFRDRKRNWSENLLISLLNSRVICTPKCEMGMILEISGKKIVGKRNWWWGYMVSVPNVLCVLLMVSPQTPTQPIFTMRIRSREVLCAAFFKYSSYFTTMQIPSRASVPGNNGITVIRFSKFAMNSGDNFNYNLKCVMGFPYHHQQQIQLRSRISLGHICQNWNKKSLRLLDWLGIFNLFFCL